MKENGKTISIVTGTYNEEGNVQNFYDRVKAILAQFPYYSHEIIVADNCSTDGTRALLRQLASRDKHFKIIMNSSNFGPVRSGYNAFLQASGDAVVLMSADLQDPPELIADMIRKWEEGFKVVVAVKSRSLESPLMFLARKLFYWTLNRISKADGLISNFTGFGLYDRKFMEALKRHHEPLPYFRGLVSEIGFRRAQIEFTQPQRKHGRSKHSFFTLYDVAMSGLVAHSKLPLRLAVLCGFGLAGASLFTAMFYLIYKLTYWNTFNLGVAPQVIGSYFFAAIQLIFIGIIGEYIGAIYTQVKNKPLAIEEEKINFENPEEHLASKTCRVCGNHFFSEPLLHYENMPKAAQNFPDQATLRTDSGVDLIVVQCSSCGLVQLADEPVPYFKEVIRAAAISEVLKESKSKQFAEFMRKYSLQGKKIIEIGCGRGEFLTLLHSLPVQAYGLEASPSAVSSCRTKGLRVLQGYPESETDLLEDAPFDAFLLLMFLEHMPRPNNALRAIYKNLSKGALGIIEVPNFDMMTRKKLYSEFIGDHLLYFSKQTLETTLQSNGFDLLEFNELRDDYVLSVVVKKRDRLDLTDFYRSQEKNRSDIDSFLDRFEARKVAIWGAGHQALAVMAMTKISDRIRYVVDSAPFKQGKFTPASHLPVVPPETLRSDPVDGIMIMAASYSDEVADILRRDYGGQIKACILRDSGLQMVDS